MSPSDFKSAPLYGGAITCDVPSDWINVSELRQVPDHQEVFVDNTHDDDNDDDQERPCLVVEILEYQTDQTDDRVGQYLFEDLADANGATERDFRGFDTDAVGLRTLIGYGINDEDNSSNNNNNHNVNNNHGNDGEAKNNTTRYRLCWGVGRQQMTKDKQQIDILVEVCVVRLPAVSTDLLLTLSRRKPTDETKQAVLGDNADLGPVFRRIISSFRIRAWSLFGV